MSFRKTGHPDAEEIFVLVSDEVYQLITELRDFRRELPFAGSLGRIAAEREDIFYIAGL
jgi:hypothetical protein